MQRSSLKGKFTIAPRGWGCNSILYFGISKAKLTNL